MKAKFSYPTFSCDLVANSLLFRNLLKVAFIPFTFWSFPPPLASTKLAKGLKRRFIETHRSYCYEILEQTDVHWQDGIEDVETYVNRHRISCGVYPILPIIEWVSRQTERTLMRTVCRYCHGLDLPDYVFENSSILRIQELTAELVKLYVPVLTLRL